MAMLYICKIETLLLVLHLLNDMFYYLLMILFFVINNLDSVEDDWASTNHVVNPFTNNIPGILNF